MAPLSLQLAMQRLESAQESLEFGKPSEALKILSLVGAVPKLLLPQKNFITAEAWRNQGFFLKAESLYQIILDESQAPEDPGLWIEAALGSAACLRSLGVVSKARARLRKARFVGCQCKIYAYADAINLEEALVDRAAGLYGRSLKKLSSHLHRHLRRRDWAQAAFVLWAMGGAQRFRGDLAGSQKTFRRSLAMAGRAKDRVGQGYAFFGLGGVTRIAGRLFDSAQFYAKARKIFERTDDVFAQAYAHCGYANALRQLGRLDEAKRQYLKSHRLYSQLEDQVDLAYVEWGLGKIFLQEGDLGPARLRLERSLQLFREHHEPRGEVLALLALAQLRHVTGQLGRAETLFEQGVRLAKRHHLRTHLEIFT